MLRKELDEIAKRNLVVKTGVADIIVIKDRYPDILSRIGNVPVTRAFVMAMRLQRGVLSTIQGKPNPLYMHNYRQINYRLDRASIEIAAHIEMQGFLAVPIAASQNVSKRPMTGHISHRLLAQWAGLGWRGRNNLLVTPEFGSQVRLVSILTNAPLDPDMPELVMRCGSCRRCIEQCPAHAIGETFEEIDIKACFKKLCEFAHIPFVSHNICGVCQKVCGGMAGSLDAQAGTAHGIFD